jgi:hypothetical protein
MAFWKVSRKKDFTAIIAIVTLLLISYHGYPVHPSPHAFGDHLPSWANRTAVSEFRQSLSRVRQTDRLPHSKTLGVASRLYVIGLPGREDRQVEVRKLQSAMGRKNMSSYLP